MKMQLRMAILSLFAVAFVFVGGAYAQQAQTLTPATKQDVIDLNRKFKKSDRKIGQLAQGLRQAEKQDDQLQRQQASQQSQADAEQGRVNQTFVQVRQTGERDNHKFNLWLSILTLSVVGLVICGALFAWRTRKGQNANIHVQDQLGLDPSSEAVERYLSNPRQQEAKFTLVLKTGCVVCIAFRNPNTGALAVKFPGSDTIHRFEKRRKAASDLHLAGEITLVDAGMASPLLQ